jgi:membrane dipeptidase
VHRTALVCDLTLPWIDYGRADLREQTLPRMIASGVDFVSLTLASDAESQIEVVKNLARERRALLSQPERYRLIEKADEIEAAKRDGMLAVSFNLQGTNALAGDLAMVEVFYKLGIRHMLLAYNKRNLVGDGCHERTDGGLSLFGIELVQEMDKVGMIVDCSHTSYHTSMEAIEASANPVIFSHSNPRALWEHDRNIRDDQAKACAASGGLVGVVGVGIFMGELRLRRRGRATLHGRGEITGPRQLRQDDQLLSAGTASGTHRRLARKGLFRGRGTWHSGWQLPAGRPTGVALAPVRSPG